MVDAQAAKLKQGVSDKEAGQKLSETQKAALEAKYVLVDTTQFFFFFYFQNTPFF